ncbi:MAG TPA: hypothetical protein VEB67_02555, partial [Nitrososphaerales archaeon]|nr:hypothetical protein [Nitrososphaerales archaeon]
MSRSQLLAISVLALILLAAVPMQAVSAQTPYTEKLNVYVSGADALWYMTFGGLNGSTKLNALESSPGLTSYNLTAVKSTAWSSDFQVFGPGGYNLLPVPFVPSQGAFLSVGSDSFSDARAAASAADGFMLTSFVSYSNGTGTYTFYSPLSYDSIVPLTLFTFLPGGEKGFASAITVSSFDTTGSPMVVLQGSKAGSIFQHDLVVGSITSGALDSLNRPNILGYFGSTLSMLTASNHSTSTTVIINTLNGIINKSASDGGTSTSNTSAFTGTYTL